MRRRDFLAGVGGAAVWPLAAQAQQPLPMIGFLSPGTPELRPLPLASTRRGLAEAGFIEGQNVVPASSRQPESAFRRNKRRDGQELESESISGELKT
jgi:hypothetical protein